MADESRFVINNNGEVVSKDLFYLAENNAEATLMVSIRPMSEFVLVDDAKKFPSRGVIRINNELILYEEIDGNRFKKLTRGFSGTPIAGFHDVGSKVYLPFIAEMHNDLCDMIIEYEKALGLPSTSMFAKDNSLWSKALYLKQKWLQSKSMFRAFRRQGSPPFEVQFIDLSYASPVRWFWDFGDGGTSKEQHPVHIYEQEGDYSVSLTTLSSISQNVSYLIKKKYIRVVNDFNVKRILFYCEIEKNGFYDLGFNGKAPLRVRFTDQSGFGIVNRIWSFGDGFTFSEDNPSKISVDYVYQYPGEYRPSLSIFDGQSIIESNLDFTIEVL